MSETPVKDSVFDLSLLIILLSNVASIVLAILQDWPMGQILWIYWAQSVIIGVINVIRMLSLKNFTTDGRKMNYKPVPETLTAKKQVAAFFALHYGIFHAAYFAFLWDKTPLNALSIDELIMLLILVFSFLGSHGFSYRYNLQNDFKHQKPNLGTLMFYPYMRIVPMHLIIIFGAGIASTGSLIFFMAMKTAADCGMHMVEHHLFRKKKLVQ